MNQISFDDLFMEVKKEVVKNRHISPIQESILALLESGETSTIEICEILIKEGKLSNERFSTNKPKAYPQVCSILDEKVQQGQILFIEDTDKKDRIYRLK